MTTKCQSHNVSQTLLPPPAAQPGCPTRQPHAPNPFSTDCGPSSQLLPPLFHTSQSPRHCSVSIIQLRPLISMIRPFAPQSRLKTVRHIYFLFSAITNSLVLHYGLKTNVRTIETHLIPMYCRHFTMHFKLFHPYSQDTSCTFTAKACKCVSSLVNEHEAAVQSADRVRRT